jgi:hypothetical protein
MRSTSRQIATVRIKTAPLLTANLFGSGRVYGFAGLMKCGNELRRAGTRWITWHAPALVTSLSHGSTIFVNSPRCVSGNLLISRSVSGTGSLESLDHNQNSGSKLADVRGYNFETGQFHLLQKPDILIC